MSKVLKRTLIGLCAAAFLVALFMPLAARGADAAETEQAAEQEMAQETAQELTVTIPLTVTSESSAETENAVEPRLFASLTLAMKGGEGDGRIYARVKNDFTLFPSTVRVIISLYSATFITTDYTEMVQEAIAMTDDLNMGEIIEVSAETKGVQRYWLARMQYRENSNDWAETTAGPLLYTADGYHIEL